MTKVPESFSANAVLSLHWRNAPIPPEGVLITRDNGTELLLVPADTVRALQSLAGPPVQLSEFPVEDECGYGS